jgi:hypothetical protein
VNLYFGKDIDRVLNSFGIGKSPDSNISDADNGQSVFSNFIEDNLKNYPKDGQFMGRIGESSILVTSKKDDGKTFLDKKENFSKNP